MKQFQRAIFFTKAPLSGYYKYRDIFQIFPADLENMPKSSLQTHHPNILEYFITDEEKIPVSTEFKELEELYSMTRTTLTKEDKILGLFSAFSNNLFFRYTDLTGNWGMPIFKDNPGEEANSWFSMWCMPMFHFPNLPQLLKIDHFTEQTIQRIEKPAGERSSSKHPTNQQQRTAVLASVF